MVKPWKRPKPIFQYTGDGASLQSILDALEIISKQLADQNKIEEIKKVSFKQGDCIVLRTEYVISPDMLTAIKDGFKTVFKLVGFEFPIIILEDGMTIEVLSKE